MGPMLLEPEEQHQARDQHYSATDSKQPADESRAEPETGGGSKTRHKRIVDSCAVPVSGSQLSAVS